MIYDSILETIGNTPLVRLKKLKKELNLEANIYVKVESFNPASSIKDRASLYMIEDLREKNLINKDTTLIEVTSGNTGIALAMIAAYYNYNLIIVMPDSMSVERQKLIKAYGAKLVLTDGSLGMNGAINKGKELLNEIENSYMISQFNNINNPKAHYLTTGKELYEALGENIDILVAGVGTGGTITGTSRYLKEKIKNIKIYAVEPEESPMLSYGKSGKHPIQGIGAGFVPDILDIKYVDDIFRVNGDDAFKYARLLAKVEAILVGISSGAALAGAILAAKKPENKDKNIVCILPDSGERYLSTELFYE